MKTLLVKLQFKLAGWLYNQGIIAPQILECNSVIILPSNYSEKDLDFYTEKQKEIENRNN